MKIRPLRFLPMSDGSLLFSSDAGDFFKAESDFLDRYADSRLSDLDLSFLLKSGCASEKNDELSELAFAKRWYSRLNTSSVLNYIILVPTLRCNLSCDYCQVSRAPENAKGFDWSDETTERVIQFLDALKIDRIKIEFQGGEPLLRVDLLSKIREFCVEKFSSCEFVVCTNLQAISLEAWEFLRRDDVLISTSLDGSDEAHRSLRTKTEARQSQFDKNLEIVLSEFGPNKVSALPTLDPDNPPDPIALIARYSEKGFKSIFLRRVNFQGFARKRYRLSSDERWFEYFNRFIDALVTWNYDNEDRMEEFYLAHAIRRIVQSGHNGNVDFRNPNWMAADYLVVDYDGNFYPSDEARMLTRVGQIDLSIGSLSAGLDSGKVNVLNQHASNFDDPDCMDCVYQPFCGLDVVDDLSRYGRLDLPRHATYHCRWQKVVFEKAFEMIYSSKQEVRSTLAHWLDVPDFSRFFSPRLT